MVDNNASASDEELRRAYAYIDERYREAQFAAIDREFEAEKAQEAADARFRSLVLVGAIALMLGIVAARIFGPEVPPVRGYERCEWVGNYEHCAIIPDE